MKTLNSTTEVIHVLGSDAVVAWMLSTTKSAVSNWRCWNKFPANTYVVLTEELRIRGFLAPVKLWAMKRRKQKRMGDNVRMDQARSKPIQAAVRGSS